MKVFISHGHNEVLKLKLKGFVQDRLKAEVVILADEPDRGLTIIEKLERYGKPCNFALVLMTADDETREGGFRARQNVVHELGFFHGVLGRDQVLLLKQTGLELFSNISGLIYKEFDGTNIECLFEDIRLAIESGRASEHGYSVPLVGDLTSWEDIRRSIDRQLDGIFMLRAPLQPVTAMQLLRKQFRQQVEAFRRAPTPEVAVKVQRLAGQLIDLAKRTPGFDLPSHPFQELTDEIKQGLETIKNEAP
jgi:hypothetical protein